MMRLKARPIAPAVSFDVVVARHRREILAYLTRMMGNRADAEDACQDALLRAHRAYPALHDHRHVRAWLFTIATRTASNMQRGSRRHGAQRSEIDPDTLPAPTTRHTNVALLAAVETLPTRQRAALMLRVFHDHSYAQIATTLDCTAAAARANVYQAIKRLKGTLQRRSHDGVRHPGESRDPGG